MKTTPLQIAEFGDAVLAVPPLARRADLRLDRAQNARLVRHMEAGGHRTLLYGGNANLYHCSVPEFGQMLEELAADAAEGTRVIPSIGPDFGKMMEQAKLLRGSGYRTAMLLPMAGFTTPEGVAEGIRRFVDAADMPITLYLKSESYIDVQTLGRLVDEGRIVAVKYAIVRDDPAEDPYLERLVRRIPVAQIVSGMGERPALVHMRRFGLASFTTGSGCIAPRACLALFGAAKRGDPAADALHARFLPMEDLRESISLIRVLHDAVTLSGIADMGAHLPLLSPCPADSMESIRAAAQALLAYDREF